MADCTAGSSDDADSASSAYMQARYSVATLSNRSTSCCDSCGTIWSNSSSGSSGVDIARASQSAMPERYSSSGRLGIGRTDLPLWSHRGHKRDETGRYSASRQGVSSADFLSNTGQTRTGLHRPSRTHAGSIPPSSTNEVSTGIAPAPLGHEWAPNIAQNWAPKIGSEQSSIRQTVDIVGLMLADIERNRSNGSRA